MTDLELKVRGILEKVRRYYGIKEEASYGERLEMLDVDQATIDFLAIIEEEKDNCPRCDWFDSLVQSKIRDKYDSLPAYCVAMEKKIAELEAELHQKDIGIIVMQKNTGITNHCPRCEELEGVVSNAIKIMNNVVDPDTLYDHIVRDLEQALKGDA